MANDLGDAGHGLVGIDDRRTQLGVALHLLVLGVRETSGLEEDRVGDTDLADVVEIAADPDRPAFVFVEAERFGDLLADDAELAAVLAGLQMARLDCRREGKRDAVEDRRHDAVPEGIVPDPGALHRGADLGRELVGRERLHDHPGRTFAKAADRVVESGEAGYDDDRDVRVAVPERPQEREPVHSRHPDVGQDKIE